MVSIIQTRQHGGHSHHHHGGGELLISKNKNDAAVRIAWVGLYSNVLMVVAKGCGGFFLNSRTMISDALHAVTDLASDILTLAAVSFAAKPPTPNNPVGFGKVESMGSVVVSGLLFTGGALMGLDAISSLWELWLPETAAHSHDHSHGGALGFIHHHHGASDLPNIHAAWIAVGSIAIKEWVYRKSKYNTGENLVQRVDMTYSHQGCGGEKIIGAPFERSTPSCRFVDEHGVSRHDLVDPFAWGCQVY